MSYQPVEAQQKKTVSVTQSCRVLDVVSRSGYYAQRQHLLEAPSVCAIGVKLQAAFAASGHTYGYQRLCAALRNEGIAIGRHRTRSLMRKHQVRPVWKRKFVNTTNSKHDLPISPPEFNSKSQKTAFSDSRSQQNQQLISVFPKTLVVARFSGKFPCLHS